MNSDQIEGTANDVTGQAKSAIGDAIGDRGLQGDGIVQQITGTLQKTFGKATDAAAPVTDQAASFAKARPFATAALAGVVGLAILNTLRGKKAA